MSPSDRIATLSPDPPPRPSAIRPRSARAKPDPQQSAPATAARALAATGAKTVRAPRRAAPAGPGVARAATLSDAIRLEDMNLLGVFNGDTGRRALVRLPDGQVLRVVKGAVMDGWTVARIDATSMRITRGGEARTLALPR